MNRIVFLFFLFVLAFVPALHAKQQAFTIVHTNDLHSHFLGFSPNIDYTPGKTGDDQTLGGWARLATVIKDIRSERDHPVLVLDAGDFMMGSLFHLQSREKAFELQLLSEMGYDMIALGNHEFDLKPRGLVRILNTAQKGGYLPPIVLSNAVFSVEDDRDNSLADLFEKGLVKPFRVIERAGIRIGFFGLMGIDAAEVAPFASPVKFGDPLAAAKEMVQFLREKEKVDLVICLSHCGLSENKQKSEDEILASEVPGIDVIVSGHTHTKMDGALQVDGTIIVQAWAYSKQAGVLDIIYTDQGTSLQDYRAVNIDDDIRGDEKIIAKIEKFEAEIDREILAADGLGFRQIIAHTDFDLTLTPDESNVGNLIADSIGWYINKTDYDPMDPVTRVAVSVISNGVIRDPILKGRTGDVAVCDVFRTIPLGIGSDDTMGYPLITFYMYPAELKKTFEVLTSIYPLKGSDYYLQISGAKFTYNPNRMIFDRVTDIWLGNEADGYVPLDYSASNKTLLRVAADIYNSTFIKVIGNFTYGILNIIPKDRQGNPIEVLKTVRVDADKKKPGLQEMKEWRGVVEYIRQFPDTNGDGVPDIPEKYKGKLGRQIVQASWNPYHLLKRGTYVTWAVFSVMVTVLLLLAVIFRRVVKMLKVDKPM